MTHKSIGRVAVIIPNLNGADYIQKAIDSLLNQSQKNDVVVVENASSDDSLAILKAYGDKITLLENRKNLGFAGGVNTGIKYALDHEFDAVALFNNDAIADKRWLECLVRAMNGHSNTGIITSSIRKEGTEQLDSTGEFYTIWGLPYPRGRDQAVSDHTKAGYVFGASGGASLYRSTMLKDIGIFDELFFAYNEDVDISFRAQLAGWAVYFEPKAVAYHRIGQTSKRMGSGFAVYQTFKNLPLLFIKNVPLSLVLPIGIRFFIAYWLMAGKAIVHGNGLSVIKGFLASIVLGFWRLGRRWKIQRNKRVDDAYIKSIIEHDLPPEQTGLRKLRKVFMGK